jgi:hypothetical protein
MNAARLQDATSSSRWLKQRCSNVIRPASARDLLSALLDHGGGGAQGVAVKHRLREAHVGHAEVRDGGAERGVADRDADHQPEREQAVHDALPELGLLANSWSRCSGCGLWVSAAEQDVVVLAHGAPQRVLEHLADLELLEVQA